MDLNAELDFPEAAFDTVLATDVLEHIREPAVFWVEVARICRPGDCVILGTPFCIGFTRSRTTTCGTPAAAWTRRADDTGWRGLS